MRKILHALVLVIVICAIPNYADAQTKGSKKQSLVTNEMAHKIAWASQFGRKNFQAHLYGDFCNANEITSSLEYDRIMENITKHKDKIEKFICLTINKWGDGDFGYAYFKNMDFTVAEFDIAVKIYDQWMEPQRERARLEEARQEEEAKRMKAQQEAKDRDTLASWLQKGKPVFPIFLLREPDNSTSNPVKAPTFTFDIEGYGWGEVISSEMQFHVDTSPNNRPNRNGGRPNVLRNNVGDGQRELPREEVTIDTAFYYTVDDDRKNIANNTRYWQLGHDWVWQVDLDSTNNLFDYIQNIYIVTPGTYTFYGIDSTVAVPTRNALRIVETRNKFQWDTRYNSNFEITLKKDKKTNEWRLNKSDEIMLRRWYHTPSLNMGWYLNVGSVESFILIMVAQINDELKYVTGKKCRLSIGIIGGGEREYFINGHKLEASNGLPFKTTINNISIIK